VLSHLDAAVIAGSDDDLVDGLKQHSQHPRRTVMHGCQHIQAAAATTAACVFSIFVAGR
jgi:adenylosuccinate lyase